MAKVLIDIPERMDKLIHSNSQIDWLDMSHVLHVVKNGIVLDGLTNGEVIQKMFPNATFEERETDVKMDCDIGNGVHTVSYLNLDWWNRKWGE